MRYLSLLLFALALSSASAAPRDARTQATYDYLLGIWGKKIIAGQSDLTWRDDVDMAQRVHDDTGKYPALMGYDYMNYYDASEADGRHQTEEAIAWSHKGGLVSFHWHWRMENGKFYTKETPYAIPADQDWRRIDDAIDRIAVELKRLQDANVPVLWRPLHEGSGGWFWWGRPRSDGVEPATAYIQLWRHMHARLTQTHGLHNLIWVWNGQDPAWYPGDDVVDITGYDIYDKTYSAAYRKAQQHAKPIALTETGYIPDPAQSAAAGEWWLWFMVWNDAAGAAGVTSQDNFWTGEYHNTGAHKRKVYNDPRVITLDRLPKF
jgi:mannan endo-1,4-beta-mannosidase